MKFKITIFEVHGSNSFNDFMLLHEKCKDWFSYYDFNKGPLIKSTGQ